jgi:HAD superfamily hydrolase (TIGR01509 family)
MPQTAPSPDILPIPEGNFRAYLFDLDGTVADSMPLHLITWQQAAHEFGGTFPEDLFWQWGGIPLPKTVEMLNERFGYHMDPTTVVHRKEQLYLELLDPVLDRIHPIKAVAAHVAKQHGHLPMAIVSGSPRLTIERTLAALHMADCFQAIVAAEDYAHGKPHPEPFLTAAKLLNVPPQDCLVFEDAEAGIQSAIAAGMQYVRVPVHHLAEPVQEPGQSAQIFK